MLDSAPYCRCCAGAAVEYLSHRCVRNSSPENTPLLFGTIHLAQQKLRTEIQLIKTQVNPRFMLGSLAVLADRLDAQAPQAVALVRTLSQFLSYVLYESQAEQVPLAHDLAAMQQYLALEQARLGAQLDVSFTLPAVVPPHPVAPLLLPLLENACQHGLVTADQAWLSVQVAASAQTLKVTVANSVDPAQATAYSPGRALASLRQRLEARYAGRYTLRLTPEPGLFVAVLTLQLAPLLPPLTRPNLNPYSLLAMKLRCLLVDDEPPALDVLESYIQAVDTLEVVARCDNAIQAFQVLQRQPLDLLFLDIQMPQLLGTDFLRSLRQPPPVIFTTAYRDYALEGFELDVVDYLLKPIPFDRFLRAIGKVTGRPTSAGPLIGAPLPPYQPAPEAFIYVHTDRKAVKVLLSAIVYIESLKDYVRTVTTSGPPLLVKQSISSLNDLLPGAQFVHIHRSYLVALGHVKSYTAQHVGVAGQELPVGGSYQRDVQRALQL